MIRGRVACVLTLTLAVAGGCRRPSGGSDAPAAAPSAPSAPASSAPFEGVIRQGTVRGATPPILFPIPSGNAPPMPRGASSSEREGELVALFSGQLDKGALPVLATPNGEPYDISLRSHLLSPFRFDANVTVSSEVEGALPPPVVDRILAQSRGRLRACFRRGLMADPTTGGTLRLRIQIAPRGEVDSVTVLPARPGTAPTNALVTGCAVGAVRSLSFPEVDAGITAVTYVAVFKNRDAAAK